MTITIRRDVNGSYILTFILLAVQSQQTVIFSVRYSHWSCPETPLEFAEVLIKVISGEQNVSCELWVQRVHYICKEGNVGQPSHRAQDLFRPRPCKEKQSRIKMSLFNVCLVGRSLSIRQK